MAYGDPEGYLCEIPLGCQFGNGNMNLCFLAFNFVLILFGVFAEF